MKTLLTVTAPTRTTITKTSTTICTWLIEEK